MEIKGDVSEAKLQYIIRDHDAENLKIEKIHHQKSSRI